MRRWVSPLNIQYLEICCCDVVVLGIQHFLILASLCGIQREPNIRVNKIIYLVTILVLVYSNRVTVLTNTFTRSTVPIYNFQYSHSASTSTQPSSQATRLYWIPWFFDSIPGFLFPVLFMKKCIMFDHGDLFKV